MELLMVEYGSNMPVDKIEPGLFKEAQVPAEITGSILHAVDEKVVMVLKDKLCELMFKGNPRLCHMYAIHDKHGKSLSIRDCMV
jgi:hypothetical protein